MSCLTWAAGRGHTVIVRMLLDHGAKVNTADKVRAQDVWREFPSLSVKTTCLFHDEL